MKHAILSLLLSLLATGLAAQADQVKIVAATDGLRMLVNGEPFMVNGMNWDYFPIGTTYSYSLWDQPDPLIQSALDAEMSLLKDIGVNAVRMYTGVPARWITYIYENHGIYTMLNHPFGRYGLTLDGAWVAQTEYGDPRVRARLLQEVREVATDYQDTPGLLLYLLGNENNYGLSWEGAETEDIPTEDRESAVRARAMYQLFNEGAIAVKSIDSNHPVALCNGDLLFLTIIAEECPDVDILGTNMYRGVSFGDAFERVKEEYGKPILFTEFGADAFNAISGKENQAVQAAYAVSNWREIYANAAAMGQAGNSIGGFTFQFSDGWWKHDQSLHLDVHDPTASWANGGYTFDFVKGQQNMNEEWFGVCAKGPTNDRGLYTLYPRAAYYALQEVHRFDPYAAGQTPEALDQFFAGIDPTEAVLKAKGDQAALAAIQSQQVMETQAKQRWTLTWQDEFEGAAGASPDPSKWAFEVGRGYRSWGNGQLQHDTDRPQNVSMDGEGHLLITARREPFAEASFTSACIKTQGLFSQTYGRFEARIKPPSGLGVSPAFWLLGDNVGAGGWPQCGEIDIMELRGQGPNVVSGTLHGPGYADDESITGNYSLAAGQVDPAFHLYAVEWHEDRIDFFVDDSLYQRVAAEELPGQWVYDHPFFLILNMSVGGTLASTPTDQAQFPQAMVVDYVRVYQDAGR
jgi:beta-glucanase (GH16 family)